MAKKTIIINQCDKCGVSGEDLETWTIRAVIDRQVDAAGDMDDVVGEMDLCGCCVGTWARVIMDLIPRDDREKLMKKFIGVQLRII